ncbi:tetratricopeptide repeat protein [Streptomyces sp. NPDC059456]|uniref:tetratricopeptide repeat protein n=1 Tax=Streptomyces sp. NPDC059456 TaxID=3346838 RepID=UPI0036C688B3
MTEQWARAEGNSSILQIARAYFLARRPARDALWSLPAPPHVFVGREEEAAELLRVLEPGGSPVSVVVGLAGVGKSALAVTVAGRAAGSFRGGVLFVALEGYVPGAALSADQAVGRLLGQLGVGDEEMPAAADGRLALYRSMLTARAAEGRRVLIVADDAGDAMQVRDLVPPGGDVHRLLVTSRDRWDDEGLVARRLALDELAPVAAADLVADVLLRTWPGDPRPGSEAAALAEIAGHCGRLPLALMVIAAVAARDPEEPLRRVAGQLADVRTRLDALSPVDRHGMPRGVRAALDLSYARLPVDEAWLLRLLTVHPGPDCSEPVAVLLAQDGDASATVSAEHRHAVGEWLAGLVGASLLGRREDRWRMHDLVRLYATELGELHAEADRRSTARERLVWCHAALLLAADSRMQGRTGDTLYEVFPDVAAARHMFDLEGPNLLAVARMVATAGRPEQAVVFAVYLGADLERQHRFEEALELAELGLAAARRMPGSVDRRENEILLLGNAGKAHAAMWQLDEALRFQQEAVEAARGQGTNPGVAAMASGLMAGLLRRSDRLDEALAAHEEALHLLRGQQDPRHEAVQLDEYGQTLMRLGRADEAISAVRRAVSILDGGEDVYTLSRVLHVLGGMLSETGRHEEAVTTHLRALSAARTVDDELAVAMARNHLADSLRPLGKVQEAVRAYEEAVEGFRTVGYGYGEGVATAGLGVLLADEGRWAEARVVLGRSRELLDLAGDVEMLGPVLLAYGRTLGRLERSEEAVPVLQRAAEVEGGRGNAPGEREALRLLAAVREGQGQGQGQGRGWGRGAQRWLRTWLRGRRG